MLQLHPAVIVQVDGRGLADIIVPVAVGDPVDQLFLAKGRLNIAADGFFHGLLVLAVKIIIVKSVLVCAGSSLGGRIRALILRRHDGTAAAAYRLGTQGALTAAGAGAQFFILVRKLPFIACAVGGGMDAADQLLVALAVIGCAAVRGAKASDR